MKLFYAGYERCGSICECDGTLASINVRTESLSISIPIDALATESIRPHKIRTHADEALGLVATLAVVKLIQTTFAGLFVSRWISHDRVMILTQQTRSINLALNASHDRIATWLALR